jgi:hypothetical protein
VKIYPGLCIRINTTRGFTGFAAEFYMEVTRGSRICSGALHSNMNHLMAVGRLIFLRGFPL